MDMDFVNYVKIKQLVDKHWQLKEAGKYEEFIVELCKILKI